MINFNPYTIALLTQESKFSCVKAANTLPLVSHDYLTRFLIKSTLNICPDITKLPQKGFLIFDDTVIQKKYSKFIENTGYVYSSSDNKVVLGLCVVLVIYVYGNNTYILDVLVWKKGGSTKNELIRDCLKKLKENELIPEVVLFDKWYNASDTLNLLESIEWKYVTLSRKNRKFEGQQIKEHKFFGANGKLGRLKRVKHMVQIIKHGDRYILTNIQEPINSVKAWKLYSKRWIIETIFRDLKSFLHVEECSSRSLRAQKNHIYCCLEVYLFLKREYPNKSVELAHQEFLQKFRKLKPKQIKDMLKAA